MTFDPETRPCDTDGFVASPSTRLDVKSDWEFLRDFFNDSYSGHSFSVTKNVKVEGGDKNETKLVTGPVTPWAFAEFQLQKCYPGFYNMTWGAKAMLCARFLGAKEYKELLCCRFFPCVCKEKDAYGIWVGWICCLHNSVICAIIHQDRWGKADILIDGMKRMDLK